MLREFLVYWAHRTTHMVPLLWRFHEVHHSSPDLDWLVVTAEYHHWHHVLARSDHDKNYGEFTGLFDVLFGTYLLPAERRPGGYGTSGNLPDDYVGQMVAPFRSRNASASGSGRSVVSTGGMNPVTSS